MLSESVVRPHRTRVEVCSIVLCDRVSGPHSECSPLLFDSVRTNPQSSISSV